MSGSRVPEQLQQPLQQPLQQNAPAKAPAPAPKPPPGLSQPDTYPSLQEAQSQKYAASPPDRYPQQQQSYQQDNTIAAYGTAAPGSDRWVGTAGKRAGKQVMATQGTKGPLTINYMSWEGDQSQGSGKDEEEAPLQAIPGAGRPRRTKLGQRTRSQSGQSSQSSKPSSPAPESDAPQQSATPFSQPANAAPKSANAWAHPAPPQSTPLPQPAAVLPQPAAAAPGWQATASAAFPVPAQQPAVLQTVAQSRAVAQLESSVQWQRMWTTEAADHNNQPVRTCLHLAKMKDLPSEDGNAGRVSLAAIFHQHAQASLWSQTSSPSSTPLCCWPAVAHSNSCGAPTLQR